MLLVWRGAFTDDELDKALPPHARWHEHAFSNSTQILWLISVSPVAVEVTAHNGVWQPGLAHMILLEGAQFTAVSRALNSVPSWPIKAIGNTTNRYLGFRGDTPCLASATLCPVTRAVG